LTESSGRTEHALFSHRLHHFIGRQAVGPQPVEIQPEAHGERAAPENIRAADSPDALDLGDDVDIGVVVEEILVVPLIGAVDVDVHQHARQRLGPDYPPQLDDRREPLLDGLDPVLDVQDRHVRVGAGLEDDQDRRLTGTGPGGDHVTHVLYAVDGL